MDLDVNCPDCIKNSTDDVSFVKKLQCENGSNSKFYPHNDIHLMMLINGLCSLLSLDHLEL